MAQDACQKKVLLSCKFCHREYEVKSTNPQGFTSNIRKAKSLSLSWAWCIWVKKYPHMVPCRDERWRYGWSTHFVLLPLGRWANHQPVYCTLLRVFQIKVLKTVQDKRKHKLQTGHVSGTKANRERTDSNGWISASGSADIKVPIQT